MPQAFDPSAIRSGSVFSDNPNYNAVWVCYVHGIETPILGFSITSGVWQPPQFEIYVSPDVSMQRMGNEDRIPVQIFYMDYWNVVDKPEPRLLVDGEIRGYRSKKAMGQRVMSFSCMAHINVFEKLYFFFMNTVDDIVAAQSPEVRAQGFTAQGLFYPYSLFHQGLFVTQAGADSEVQSTTAESTDQTQGAVVKTAHEIHYNVVKGIIASAPTVPDDKRSLPMMNFFARHTRKTRLHQRFVRLPIFEDLSVVAERKGVFPIFAAVRADEALTAMQHQVAGRIGNSGSIWEMLKQIYSLVYMEFACIPNPAAVHTNMEGEIEGPVSANDLLIEQRPRMSAPTAVQTGVATPSSIGSDPSHPIRLAQCFAKPQFLFGIPPHCNVFFPSMIDDLSYGEDYGDQPTRVYVNDTVMGNVLRASGPNREFMLHALTVAYPEEADAVMHAHTPDAGQQSGTLHETGKNLLLWPEEFFKGPVTAKIELPSWFQTMMQFLNASEGGGGGGTTGGGGGAAPAAAAMAAGGTVTPTALSGPNPIITIPQRGRDDSRVYLPDSWVLPPNVIAAGMAHPPIRRDNGERDMADGEVMGPYPAIRALARYIEQIFPGHLSGPPEFRRPARRAHGSKNDLHIFGRACDLPIRQGRGGAVNHIKGDPIANWLVQNAAAFGIQFMVWATTQWHGNARRGQKHGPYALRTGNDTALHRDHIHFEINLDGAHGLLGGYSTIGVRPTTPSAALPSTSGTRPRTTAPVVTAPALTIAPPTPRAPVVTVARTTSGAAAAPGAVAQGGTANRGPNDTAPSATSTTTEAPTTTEDELPANQKFANLFRLYAQYEYARQRYMQKNGAVTMRFNPYVVAGFPCIAFDRAVTSEHIVAYVYTVTHTAMGKNISTSVGLTCVRTFPEFLNDVRNDCERFSERITAAPAEMIPEVRRIIQNEDQAEIFYQRLFYGGARPGNLPAAFHFDRAIGYTRGLDVEDIAIEGSVSETAATSTPGSAEGAGVTSAREALDAARTAETAARAAAAEAESSFGSFFPGTSANARYDAARTASVRATQRREQAERDLAAARRTSTAPAATEGTTTEGTTTRSVTHNIDPNEALTPLPNTIYTDAFDSYHVAMQLAARNVCTLTEFIRFWHGGRALGDLIASGDVEGPEDDYAYGSVVERDVVAAGAGADGGREVTVGQATRYTGVFYKRIFRLRPGPGRPPTESERGYTEGATPSGHTEGVPGDYPESRADWDSVLLAYRRKVRERLSPST